MSEQFYFKQFSLNIKHLYRTLSGATTAGLSGPGSDRNEGVLCIPQSFSISGTSPSDCLMSNPGHTLRKSYPSVEMQLVYSTTPFNSASKILKHQRSIPCVWLWIKYVLLKDWCLSTCIFLSCFSFLGKDGLQGDGDVFKPENQQAFTDFVKENTDGKGVHFVMADGVSISLFLVQRSKIWYNFSSRMMGLFLYK